MYIDNQPVWVGQHEGGKLAHRRHLQHYPRHARLVLGHADLLQEAIIHIKRLAR